MDQKESSPANFIPKDLLDIICILERDENHHSYKIIRIRYGFFTDRQISRQECRIHPIEENTSVQQPASHQDKNQLSSEDKLRNKG